MKTTVETITPELAKAFLASSRGNRKIRPKHVSAIAEDMRGGNWRLTHQGIAFDEDGRLIDGHHRLNAVVLSGVSIESLVFRGVVDSGLIHVDRGAVRSIRDSLTMSGHGTYSHAEIAVARVILIAPSMAHPYCGPQDALDTLEKHRDAIAFAYQETGHIKTVSRGTRTAIARAWYHVDQHRLREFCQVLRTLIPVSKNPMDDSAALTLYRHLSQSTMETSATAETLRYQKAQSAIDYFCKRRPMSRVVVTTEDLYPLPS